MAENLHKVTINNDNPVPNCIISMNVPLHKF